MGQACNQEKVLGPHTIHPAWSVVAAGSLWVPGPCNGGQIAKVLYGSGIHWHDTWSLKMVVVISDTITFGLPTNLL
jgi:hypothetical protein